MSRRVGPYAVWKGPREPYVALDHVRHARKDGCIKTKSEWADELTFADDDQPVTCNDCQRAVWTAAARKSKASWRDVPKLKIAAVR